ncbi:hypothetical protein M8C21_017049 [Ambrosia artemisiifolia]|uniref:CBM20 domain-containing protein n=1 Tax=Ambrosia artemisiifolia TaxID=4212 RepID=A0AAD5C0P4_AMBAR|nr:hypothetical protein M8C21_017049 [Ambrosia artemisiifolia]
MILSLTTNFSLCTYRLQQEYCSLYSPYYQLPHVLCFAETRMAKLEEESNRLKQEAVEIYKEFLKDHVIGVWPLASSGVVGLELKWKDSNLTLTTIKHGLGMLPVRDVRLIMGHEIKTLKRIWFLSVINDAIVGDELIWGGSLTVPAGFEAEYSYYVVDDQKNVLRWEGGNKRKLVVPDNTCLRLVVVEVSVDQIGTTLDAQSQIIKMLLTALDFFIRLF